MRDRLTTNEYMRIYLKRRYDARWPIAVKILGGRCVECSATDRLQFDHIDPRSKSFKIADKIAQYAWPRIMAEIAKCQLLCFDCHVEKSKIDNSPARRLALAYQAA